MRNDTSTWVVAATGSSLSQEDLDYVRGKCKLVVISDAYRLAPWADALVSYDAAWWNHHKEALAFEGDKVSARTVHGVKRWMHSEMENGCNSGLMGMYYAKGAGASRIILLGFDMHGTHFFGKHPEEINGKETRLKNTPPQRFEVFKKQFRRFYGCEVINCTQGSALDCFKIRPLRDVI
jgi:hypothetical protein